MTTQIRRILFATDFSDTAKKAQAYAATLAASLNSELHALTVVIDPVPLPSATGISIRPKEDPLPQLVRTAELQLSDQMSTEITSGLKVHCSVKVGDPVLEIMQYAKLHDIELIVMGTRGRTGLAHLLIGSVAETIVRMATCPVLTVRP